MRKYGMAGALALTGVLTAGGAQAQGQQAPTATYWVTADTNMSAMGLAPGDGGGPGRSLVLQLATTRPAAGEPSADHAPPAELGAGPRLPLVTPKPGARSTGEGAAGGVRGRVLVYWGCGAQARPGQPMTIDLARPGSGSAGLGAGLGALTAGAPSPGPGRTYGEWPNGRPGATLGPRASLVGAHLVRGNYTPDIRFSLAANQDFLPPLRLSGMAADASGATPLEWSPVVGAGGYFASVVGAGEGGDTVIWTSSEIPIIAGQVPDHLAPADLKRLVARKAVLGPDARGCAIPAAVSHAAPAGLLRVVALGGEVDFVSPPRPSDPKAPWKPDYTVKVRYASISTAMLGLDAPAGDEDDDADAGGQDSLLGLGARSLIKGLGAIGR